MIPFLIDSHCHPPDAETDPDHNWLSRAIHHGVRQCIAVGTNSEDWERYRALRKTFPENIYWTAGLHPGHVGPDYAEHLSRLPAFLATPEPAAPCALGEIGLDFTRLPKTERDECIQRQRNVFALQLSMAAEHELPVVLHSRGTVDECLAVLAETGFPADRAIFHCFAEGPETLAKIKAVGAKCSFTGIITFKSAANVREAMRANGLKNLILETDSPYLSPEPYRGKQNEPSRIATLANFCADFFETTPENIASITTENTRKFFGLPKQ